jgi:peptidase E
VTGHIVAVGGGGGDYCLDGPLTDLLLELSGASAPRILAIGTASADDAGATTMFYSTLSRRGLRLAHLQLFDRTVEDLRPFVLDHDVIWVGGGNTASMLAVWRAHGVDPILREAWEGGAVLAGVSAGAICWFQDGVTDSWGPTLGQLGDGLGWLEGSLCPHYDGEEQRKPTYRGLVASGSLAAGLAVDEKAAARFEGTHLVEAVSWGDRATVYRVEPDGDAARETPLEARGLG